MAMKLVIDRQKWFRGHGLGSNSALMREQDEKMCCLGFHALACGYKKSDLKGAFYPSTLLNRKGKRSKVRFPEWLVSEGDGVANFSDSKEGIRLANTNDSDEITERQREKKLKQMFANHGVQVEFIG